jgi:hypothetical protein
MRNRGGFGWSPDPPIKTIQRPASTPSILCRKSRRRGFSTGRLWGQTPKGMTVADCNKL